MERLVVDLSRFLYGEKLPHTVLCLNQSIALAVHSGWPIDVRAPETPSGFQLHLTDPPPKRRLARRLTRPHSALDQHGQARAVGDSRYARDRQGVQSALWRARACHSPRRSALPTRRWAGAGTDRRWRPESASAGCWTRLQQSSDSKTLRARNVPRCWTLSTIGRRTHGYASVPAP